MGREVLRRITLLLATVASAWAATPPDFAHDVAPILYRACSECHHEGGTAPFSLLRYEDAHKRAPQIAAVTRTRTMPPWLAEHGYGDFEGERRLSDREIRTLSEWAGAGAPEGRESEIPPAPAFTSTWQLGKPDLVVEASAPFQVPATGMDVYWNFVLKPGLRSVRYVRAVEIRPGERHLVHHANLLVDRTGSAQLREASPGAGFPGMDLEIMRSPFDPPGHFMFWKPGSAQHQEPPGFVWRLNPTDELVLNVHMHPSGKATQIRPAIGLYFTDQPPTRFPLLVQMENDEALDIPPGARDFLVSDDFRLPLDVEVQAIYPHAHYLGKLLEAYATLPDGTRKWLIRIPAWNPDWQAVFYYREPVLLPRGSVVSMRFHYDNSADNARNPNHPPRRVVGGNQSTDEMASLWLELLPRGAGDRRRELEEAVMRHKLEKNPTDFAANLNLGAVLLSRLKAAGAVGALQTAAAVNPQRADARNMLGLALGLVGREAEAMQQFAEALRLRPDYAAARFNLANAQVKAGQFAEAIENFKQVIAASPGDPLPPKRLEEALRARQARKAR